MPKKKLTKEQAITNAIEWGQLHDQAQCEEEAGCFGAAETMRMEAADMETEIRNSGFDALDLWETFKKSRR